MEMPLGSELAWWSLTTRPTGDLLDGNGDDDTAWLVLVGDSRNDVISGNISSVIVDNVDKNTTVLPFDEDDYLEARLGVRYRSIGESVTLTVVYCLVLFTGVVGNVATCVVIIRNSYMHTATNCYLFSLAVSDTLSLVLGLPPELYTVWEAYPWRFGEPYCLFKTFLTEVMSSASVLTITAFTVERFVAICHPLWAQTVSNPSRAVKAVFLIWLAASITSLPYPINTRTFYYLRHPLTGQPITDSLVCNIPLDWMPRMKYVIQATTGFLFVLPMCLMTVLYVSVALAIRRPSPSSLTSQQSTFCSRSSDARYSEPDQLETVADAGEISSQQCQQSQQHRRVEGLVLGRSSLRYAVLLKPPRRRGSANVQMATNSRRAILPLLVAVLVMFFICWAPFHAQRILTACVPDDCWTATLIEIQSTLFYISGVLYYVSSTVNPILYNLMSYRYRRAFCDTLHCATRRSSSRRAAMSRDMSSRLSGRSTMPGPCLAPVIKSTSFRSSTLIHQQRIIGRQQPCHDHQHYNNHGHHLHHNLPQPQLVHRGFNDRVISTSSSLIVSPAIRTLPHASHVPPL